MQLEQRRSTAETGSMPSHHSRRQRSQGGQRAKGATVQQAKRVARVMTHPVRGPRKASKPRMARNHKPREHPAFDLTHEAFERARRSQEAGDIEAAARDRISS